MHRAPGCNKKVLAYDIVYYSTSWVPGALADWGYGCRPPGGGAMARVGHRSRPRPLLGSAGGPLALTLPLAPTCPSSYPRPFLHGGINLSR